VAGRFVLIVVAALGARQLNFVVDDRACRANIIIYNGRVRLIGEELAEAIGGARRGRGLGLPRSTGASAGAAPAAIRH
jgi:hypothetical protein